MSTWTQIYDPLNNIWLSALIAALPIFCFIICLMGLKMKSYIAGLYSVIVAIILAIFVYKMPATVAVASADSVFYLDFIQFVLLLSQQFSFTN